jgi:hypothetical protein
MHKPLSVLDCDFLVMLERGAEIEAPAQRSIRLI